jgi:hypothetical protein
MHKDSKQEVSEPKQRGDKKNVSMTPAEQALRLLKILQFSLNGMIVLRTGPTDLPKRDWHEIDPSEWDEQFASRDNLKKEIQTCRDAIRRTETQKGQLENTVLEVKHQVDRTLIRLERFVPLMYQVGPIDLPCLEKCFELSNELEEAIVSVENLATQKFVVHDETGVAPQKSDHATEIARDWIGPISKSAMARRLRMRDKAQWNAVAGLFPEGTVQKETRQQFMFDISHLTELQQDRARTARPNE